MKEYLIEIHNTERKYTLKGFLDYFQKHNVKNCRFNVSKDKKCPDIKISTKDDSDEWKVVFVSEAKHDLDARQSRDNMHLYNNFNGLLRDYPDVPKYFFVIEHNKKSLRWDRMTKKKKMLYNLNMELLGHLMHEGFARGFETIYVSYERFIEKVFELVGLKEEDKIIDIGHHFLEKKGCYKPKVNKRKKCSEFETSLTAYSYITPKRAYEIAQKYPNMYEFVKAGITCLNCKGRKHHDWDLEIIPTPENLDLDDIIPLNKKGGKTKFWANFITKIFGKYKKKESR
jgi:hypothetical protein